MAGHGPEPAVPLSGCTELWTLSCSVSARGQLRRRASLPRSTLPKSAGLEERETVLGVCGEACAAIACPRHAAPWGSAIAAFKAPRRPSSALPAEERAAVAAGGREAREGWGGTRRARERIAHVGPTETSGPPVAPARDRLPQRAPAETSPAFLPPVFDRSPQKSVRNASSSATGHI